MYYAHSTVNPDKSDWQSLKTHLKNVADRSKEFATDFHTGELAYVSGLLHDLGKYSPDFQKRLDDPRIRVDHSTAGALEAGKIFNPAYSRILSYIIIGHHGGLLNFGSIGGENCVAARLGKKDVPDYSVYPNEITLPDQKGLIVSLRPFPKKTGFCFSFFTRMLYSCLVDADSLDTEQFCNPDKATLRTNFESFEILAKRFDAHMQKIQSGASDSLINRERKKIFSQCIEAGSLPPGMFSLTVPTGGGKTLSSMGFALEHLKTHDLKRIFYVIPYTSIIEQNANIFRDIFGKRNVLEHHSNFDPESLKKSEEDPICESLKLATENWDVPVIVTTNVQFFESLFSNKRSRTRKLHNLAKSVIILDEAQMLPIKYLLPCLAALAELVRNYGASVVICTATQPKLEKIFMEHLDPKISIHEIMQSPDPDILYKTLNRVHVTTQDHPLSDAELSSRLKQHGQVLCIVNTRKHARSLFDAIKESGNSFHLSARMCPAHRRKKIKVIKDLLKEGKECRVISTQLIEAGVDIDFPVVYRMKTGIDSIAQAAGRCNREGKLPGKGEVYIFQSAEKHGRVNSWQNLAAEVGEMVLAGSDDPLSLPIIADYFQKLYHFKGTDGLDEEKILSTIEERAEKLEFQFEDIAEAFRIIDDGTRDIIIPYDRIQSKIDALRSAEHPGKFIRDLQGYTVGVYPSEFREMKRDNAVEIIADRFYVLRFCEDYSDETGLKLRQDAGYDGSLSII